MSKKKTISAVIIGATLLAIIGGGALLFKSNSQKQRVELLNLASDYVDNYEYDKALGILEAIFSGDKENSELIDLIAEIKEKKRQFNENRVEMLFAEKESQLYNRVEELMASFESALKDNQLRVAEVLRDEILRIDPDNQAIVLLDKKISELKNELLINNEKIRAIANDIKKAIEDRSPDLLKDGVDKFTKEIKSTFNNDLDSDIDFLQGELNKISPNNSLIDQANESKLREDEAEDNLLEDLAQFELEVAEILDAQPEKSFDEKLADIKQAENLVERAKELLKDNRRDEAKELLDEALKLDPENSNAKKLKNLIDESENSLNNVLKAEELALKAEKLIQENKIEEAKALLETALALDPENVNIQRLNQLIKSDLDKLKRVVEANELLRDANKLINDNKIDEAKVLVDKALSLDVENIEGLRLKTLLENKDNNLEKKIQSNLLLNRAILLLNDNKTDEAFKLLEEAISLDPSNEKAKKLLELLKNSSNLIEQSLQEDITSSDNLNSKIADVLEAENLISQAEKSILKNDLEGAKRLIDRALELDPENLKATKIKELLETKEKELTQEAAFLPEESPTDQLDDLDLDEEHLDNEELDDEQTTSALLPETELENELEDELEDTKPEINIDELIKQAAIFEKSSQFEKQIDVLSQILDEEPSPEFYVKAGIASYKITNYDNAIDYFQQAIDMDPNYPSIYYPMALSYEKLDDSTMREKMLNIGLKLRPNHGATNYELGRYYTSEGLHIEALELFLNAKNINEKSIKYQLGVALAYYNLEDYEKAIEIYENINTQNNNISEVHYNLSMARSKVGDLDKALIDISKAIELKPKTPSYLYTIGEISEALGRVEKAASYYLEALKLDITYYKPMLNLGNIYDQLGRYQDSVTLLEKALKLEPDDENARYSLGTSYLHNKQYSKAISLLKITHENDPKSAVKLYSLALAYTEIGDVKAAEESFLSVIDMNSNFYDAYYYLGQLLYSADRIDEARTYFDKVLELNPEYKFKQQILELP